MAKFETLFGTFSELSMQNSKAPHIRNGQETQTIIFEKNITPLFAIFIS